MPTALRLGKVPGVMPAKWQRLWGQRFDVPLEIHDVTVDGQLAGLRDGTLDMCFVRLPISPTERAGLHTIPLYEEVMVAWVAKDHVVSAVDEVTLADLEDEQVVRDAASADLLLAGVVAVVPMSIARSVSRRDLTYRPIVDAEPSPIALAWRVGDENPYIEEFIGVVRGRTVTSSRGAPELRKPAREASSRRSGRSAQGRAGGEAAASGASAQHAGKTRRGRSPGGPARGMKRRRR